MILVVNKVDRPDARIAEVVDEVYELFLDLDADEEQIEFPIVYCNAQGRPGVADPRASPGTDLEPLLDLLLEHIPAPAYDPEHPLQAHVTNLDASPYVGRLALCRVRNGHDPRGPAGRLVPRRRHDRARAGRRALRHRGARPRGGRRGRAGRDHRRRRDPRGHDRRDARRPRRPAAAAGDHRRRAVAVGDDRHQHLAAGRPGRQQAHRPPGPRAPRRRSWSATSRCACCDTERPDAWEVQGRGELQLAVLVEMMRREGFELTVGQPQVSRARSTASVTSRSSA